MNALAKLSFATTALAEAKTLEDVKAIVDIAEAARTYAKAAKLGLDAQNHAAELKLRAERKAGELLASLERRPGERTDREPQSSLVRGSEYGTVLQDTATPLTTAKRWQAIAKVPDPVFEQHVATVKAEAAELTSAGMLRVAKELERAAVHMAKREAAPLPVKRYRVIYADPPWAYNNSGFDQSADAQYPTLSIDAICALPVSSLADSPCVLYLWATAPLLPDALRALQEWGFEYKTHRVWAKDRAPGLGWWLQTKHELLLIGTYGGNYHPSEKLPSVASAPVGRHSEKPPCFREDIMRVHDGPYLELFARVKPDGWDIWGNEPDVE